MSTGLADDRRGRRPVAALLLLTLLAPGLAGCADDEPGRSHDPGAEAAAAISRTLGLRARALRSRDEALFGRTFGRRDADFAAQQRTYFDNVAQLPLATLRYDLDEDTVEADHAHFWAEVEVRTALDGFDAAPVVTRDRYRFTPTRDHSRYLLTSTTDPRWEQEFRPQPQPWDLEPVEVREEPGVMGVFDTGTSAYADDLMESVADGRRDVADVVPGGARFGVVVYALADRSYLDSLGGLPVSDPDRLDAVTIPVPQDASVGDGPAASYRVLLSARVLAEDGPALDRLVRHELTHVALGDRARGAPLWLSEGIAEYVSVRAMSAVDRRLPVDALSVAAHAAEGLPPDAVFSGPQAEAWYAVAWWICEYVAATYGEPALWSLLDGLVRAEDDARAVTALLGTTPAELAAEGVGLMQRTYG